MKVNKTKGCAMYKIQKLTCVKKYVGCHQHADANKVSNHKKPHRS
jgi:hypothetical protein